MAAIFEDRSKQITIRKARESDVEAIAALLVRLKRLNAEFDPLLSVRPDAPEQAVKLMGQEVADPARIILAVEGSGEDEGKVIGFARGTVRERPFYAPVREGVILDIYLMPAYRRGGAGAKLLREMTKRLKEMGAEVVAAEFPSQNVMAVNFYAKSGFRAVTSLHAKGL